MDDARWCFEFGLTQDQGARPSPRRPSSAAFFSSSQVSAFHTGLPWPNVTSPNRSSWARSGPSGSAASALEPGRPGISFKAGNTPVSGTKCDVLEVKPGGTGIPSERKIAGFVASPTQARHPHRVGESAEPTMADDRSPSSKTARPDDATSTRDSPTATCPARARARRRLGI